MHLLCGPDQLFKLVLYMNIVAISKRNSNIKNIFNSHRTQVCESTQGGRIIHHRGDIGGLLSTAQRAVLQAL